MPLGCCFFCTATPPSSTTWRPMCRSSTPMNASVRSPCAAVPLPNGDTDGASWWSIDTETTQRDLGQFRAGRRVGGPDRRRGRCREGPARAVLRRWFLPGGYLALTLVGKADAPRYGGVWAICCGLRVRRRAVDLSSGDGRPALVQWGTRDPIVATDQAEAVVASSRPADGRRGLTPTTWPIARRSR